MSIQHVPAWRKLGLKLKYANEDSQIQVLHQTRNVGGQKRKQGNVKHVVNGLHTPERQLKRSRLDDENSGLELNVEKNSKTSANTSPQSLNKKKKSVSFTSDTKTDDGDSAQTIQFWSPDSPGSTPKKGNLDTTTDITLHLAKRPKKRGSKKTEDQSLEIVPRKATAALNYLDQFLYQRAVWKFNKNHETWILKHALSTENIPQKQNLALALYIQGLNSVGARQRLLEQSYGALAHEDDKLAEDSDIRTRLLQVLETARDSISRDDHDEQQQWTEQLDRSRLILISLHEDVRKLPASKIGGQIQPRVKKNKSRTSRVEVESSSSSESESEDEEDVSSSSNSETTTLQNGIRASQDLSDEETSSSEASSGSSDDEGEDRTTGSEDE